MRIQFGTFASLAAAFFLATYPTSGVAAPVLNGRFETGDLSSWTFEGSSATVVDSSFGIDPIQGDYSALLVARDGWGCRVDDPWGISCSPPVSMPGPGVEGPSLSNEFPTSIDFFLAGLQPDRPSFQLGQDIDFKAGERLTLDWRFLSNDIRCPGGPGFADNAGVFLTNGETLVGVNAGTNQSGPPCESALAPSSTGFKYVASLKPVSITLPSAGLWTVFISVFHGPEDNLVSSGLMVDNIKIERRVPEPTSLGVVGAALAGLAATRKRRRMAPIV